MRGPDRHRAVASGLIREYIYLHGAVSPKDGTRVYLIMPTSNTACFQAFLNVLSRKFARRDILLVLDGAPNHRSSELVLPGNISALFPPPHAPELKPPPATPLSLAGWLRRRTIRAMKSAKRSSRTMLLNPSTPCARGDDPLHGTQARNCKIHPLIPQHHQVTLMWKWYKRFTAANPKGTQYHGGAIVLQKASESRASRARSRSSIAVKAGDRRKLSSRSRLRVTGSAATSSSSQ